MRLARLLLTLALCIPATVALAQTGKIAGRVTDASTGDPLPGVNVSIVGSTQGTVADADGYYTIINVRPGSHDVRASFIGFTTQVREDVRVNIDLTATVNFAMSEETVGLQELVVQAERPIVQADISANVANLNPEQFENLPVAGISEVLDLQAGIEPGLQIRGGGLGEVAIILDGLNTRTGRNNAPLTNISYTSLEEVQVQTGGFNAEYGNVRAGIVNVATKEPRRDRYTFDAMFRYTPAQAKTFNGLTQLPENCDYSGTVAPDCDTWWARPALDPAVNMEGTKNTTKWDRYQKRQYFDFEGWNSVVSRLRDKGFDVNAQDMVEYFKYTHRKDNTIDIPDYDADFTFGGPIVPGGKGFLGDLRFLASYRGTQTSYLYPQTRDAYKDQTFQLKLVSQLAPGMKLTVQGLATEQRGQSGNADAASIQLWQGNLPAYPWTWMDVYQVRSLDIRGDEIYTDGQFALADIDHNLFGGRFTHTLNAKTFYEVSLQRVGSKYRSRFPNLRDGSYICPDSGQGPDGATCKPGEFVKNLYTDNFGNVKPGFESKVKCFGGKSDLNGDGKSTAYCVGQEPFGYGAVGGNLETGESTGGHWVKTRDTSNVQVWTGRFDLTSQFNRFIQLKTGAELIYSDYDMHYARVNLELIGPEPEEDFPWQRSPIQGAAYAQGKLEFQGMVANLGMRLDYFDPNTDWWQFDSYDQALRYRVDRLDQDLTKKATDAQVSISPRLGVSFPITQNSKLYFNYGHFRQMLDPSNVFGVQQSKTGGIDVIGNPNHPMPKTVAYELGYDQNLFDQFLLRISGFYRDIRDQPRWVGYRSLGNVVVYSTQMPWNYEDVRGAEISVSKMRGKWFQGFANYTYLQRKEGNFGYATFYENSFDMLNFLRDDQSYRLWAPVAEPFARVNLLFLTPPDFGPDVAGLAPLGDWRVSFLGEWRAGQTFTWAGGGSNPEIRNNVSWRDYYDVDLRLTKRFDSRMGDIQFFADIDNVFNIRHLFTGGDGGFITGCCRDREDYMRSLHLPGDIFKQLPNQDNLPYVWVPGNDKPGDYRKDGVPFQPIEARAKLPEKPDAGTERAWYWAKDSGKYMRWSSGSWQEVPQGDVDKVLDEKGYIDMPNHKFHTFLNPRRVTVGLRFSF